MADGVLNCEDGALNDATWLRSARSNFDVGAALASALTPFWTIDRELDPFGELTVIVLPVHGPVDDIVDGTAPRPSFILYETDAVVQVSTFVCDDWRSRQTFRTCQRAVDAIIRAASKICPPPPQASRTSLIVRARSSAL